MILINPTLARADVRKGIAGMALAALLIASGRPVPAYAAAPSPADATSKEDLLHAAFVAGNKADVLSLLAAGADPNSKDRGGNPALLSAVIYFSDPSDVVSALINAGANPNATSRKGRTALMAASFKGYENVVKTLLRAGADLNLGGPDGMRALFQAAVQGNAQIVRDLLESGANVNASHPGAVTALIFAASTGRGEQCETVKALIEGGADVNRQRENGQTALIGAVAYLLNQALSLQSGKLATINLLLAAGANVSTGRSDGDTALEIGKQTRNQVLIDVLQEISARQAGRSPDTETRQRGVLQLKTRVDDLKQQLALALPTTPSSYPLTGLEVGQALEKSKRKLALLDELTLILRKSDLVRHAASELLDQPTAAAWDTLAQAATELKVDAFRVVNAPDWQELASTESAESIYVRLEEITLLILRLDPTAGGVKHVTQRRNDAICPPVPSWLKRS